MHCAILHQFKVRARIMMDLTPTDSDTVHKQIYPLLDAIVQATGCKATSTVSKAYGKVTADSKGEPWEGANTYGPCLVDFYLPSPDEENDPYNNPPEDVCWDADADAEEERLADAMESAVKRFKIVAAMFGLTCHEFVEMECEEIEDDISNYE